MTTVTPLPDLDTVPPVAPRPTPRTRIASYRRTPRDLFRAVVYLVVTLAVLVPTLLARNAILGFEQDLVRLVSFLSDPAERILVGILQVGVGLTLLAVWITPLVTRRYRLFGYIAAANVVAGLLATGLDALVDEKSDVLRNELASRAGVSAADFPNVWGYASLAAAFVVLAPFVSRRWRRAGAVVFTIAVLLRIVVSAELPAELFVAVAAGGVAGALVLFAFGRPDQRPTDDAVVDALRASGLAVATLAPASVDARGSVPYFGTLDDGSAIFAKVLGDEERSADLLFRMYRWLRFRNLGDERPFSSLRRAVEHEAFLALQARDLGARTPRLRAVATTEPDAFVLAYDRIPGRTLDAVEPATVDDALLHAVWEQAAILRSHRIAHRDLRRANILVDDDGTPWVIDFGFAETAASDTLLDADVAQLICALAIIVGAARSVDAAVGVIGREAVAHALPRMQMAALSGATQTTLKAEPGLLKEIVATVEDRTGVDEVEFEPLSRLTAKQLLTVVMLVLVTYFLLPQLADLPQVWENVQGANWWWFIAVLAASLGTYLGAALAFMGSVPDRLAFGPTLATQVGSSFVSKLAPAGLGGMALNVRYAQRRGVDAPVAVSAVGLNAVAGVAVHLILLGVFVLWAGREAFGGVRLPNPKYAVYGLVAVLAFAAVSLAVPAVRSLVRTKLFPIIGRSVGGLRAVATSPLKVALLIGGSAMVTLSYVVALYLSTLAFGGHMAFATVGAVYLAGSAVAQAAPTPGGLGAMEAALVAGLRAAGMAAGIALPAVFMFRLATFWLPILPGWGCFTWLRRAELV